MTHEGPPGGTPFREPADPDAEALERMRKQIEAEGKRLIVFDDNIEDGAELPQIIDVLQNKKVSFLKDIVLYSPKRGQLTYSQMYNDDKKLIIEFRNPKFRRIMVTVRLSANRKRAELYFKKSDTLEEVEDELKKYREQDIINLLDQTKNNLMQIQANLQLQIEDKDAYKKELEDLQVELERSLTAIKEKIDQIK